MTNKTFKDPLGDEFKLLEDIFRVYIPSKHFMVIRCDGRAFHSYTKYKKKPFDSDLMDNMNTAAQALVRAVSGSIMAFVQSDEISIIASDLGSENSEHWFGGNIQKIASVSAVVTSNSFNVAENAGQPILDPDLLAQFDGRVFALNSIEQVNRYLVWRQQDTIRNSISSVGRNMFSHNELDGKSSKDIVQMLKDAGDPWEAYPEECKFGRVWHQVEAVGDVKFTRKDGTQGISPNVTRNVWEKIAAPIFDKTTFTLDTINKKLSK